MAEPMLLSKQPGAWRFARNGERTYMWFNCPCGCAYEGVIRVRTKGEETPEETSYKWDGDEIHPTLTPSLRRATPCKFHGHLQKGIWSAYSGGAPVRADCYQAETIKAP